MFQCGTLGGRGSDSWLGINQALKCSMWNKMEIGDSNLLGKFHVERLNVNVLIRKLYLVTFAR